MAAASGPAARRLCDVLRHYVAQSHRDADFVIELQRDRYVLLGQPEREIRLIVNGREDQRAP